MGTPYPYKEGVKPDINVGLLHRAELLVESAEKLRIAATTLSEGSIHLVNSIQKAQARGESAIGNVQLPMSSDIPTLAATVHRHASILDSYIELLYFIENAPCDSPQSKK